MLPCGIHSRDRDIAEIRIQMPQKSVNLLSFTMHIYFLWEFFWVI